jgi:signal transduction histidine kinase
MVSDLIKVRQILLNLAGNAAKFTHDGAVTISAGRLGSSVEFTVTDTGIGIAPENVERLFEPFSQAESSTTRRFGGTGLGLAISRRFCHMLGGDIEVVSAPGQGSSFIVRLPVRVGEPAAPAPVAVAVIPPASDGDLSGGERPQPGRRSAPGPRTPP